MADLLGKIWNLPNDAIGLVFGGLGYAVGWSACELGAFWQPNAPTIGFGGNPLVMSGAAITFGNVESFGTAPGGGNPAQQVVEGGAVMYQHKDQHTYIRDNDLGLCFYRPV